MLKFNYNLEEVMNSSLSNIKNIVTNKEIENVILVNKRTFIFLFKDLEKRLVISLNHLDPNIYLLDKLDFYTSFESEFLNSLKNKIKGLVVSSIHNDDLSPLIKISFQDSKITLLIKLLPYKNNLYLLDNDVVIDSFFKDDFLEKDIKPFTLKELNKEDIQKHFSNEISIREKEKYDYFLTFLKGRIKRVKRKIENINLDKNKALENLKYSDYANEMYCLNLDLKEHKKEIKINEEIIPLDESKRIIDNINNFFKISKKAKETIRLADSNIIRAEDELKEYESLLNKFNASKSEKEKEKIILESNFFKKKCEIKETPFNKPYKINFNGTIIYFGKTASQNDYLSFVKKLDREFYWLHIKNLSGSHIVIANKKPTNKEIQLASELACILSKVNDGTVSITKKKNVRRGKVLGEAILKNYSSIKINRISEESKEIYLTAVRDD